MRSVRWLTAVCALALLATPLWAQGIPTAKLTGRVTSDGEPLPGVTVIATSPNLQGERQSITSENGDYLFPSLPPGEYEVRFELSGLEAIQNRIRLGAAQSAVLDTEMKLQTTLAEEIVVTGNLEQISGGSQSATTYTQELINELPAGRTINDIVALAPGIHTTGPGKAATGQGSAQGQISVAGAVTFENLFLVNGVVINENIRGTANDLFIEDAIQETTTATSGVSAEYGRFSGGVVNVVTRSGGNDFSGSARVSYFNQDWQEKTPLTTVQTDDIIPTYELTFGGPLLRDRLWFFLAGRDFESLTTANTSVTNLSYQTGQDERRYEGKLTWSLTPSHNLVGSYMDLEESQPGNNFPPIMDLASIVTRETPEELMAFNYNGAITSNFFLTGQYSEREFAFIGSGAPFTDRIRGTLMLDRTRGNARWHSPTFCGVCTPEERNNENALIKGSYFLSSSGLGTHELVGGYDLFNDIRSANNHQSGSDYRIFASSAIIQGTNIYPVFRTDNSTIIQFNPIAQASKGTNFETHSIFVNDNWRLNDRLSFNIGVRYDRNDGQDAAGATVVDDSKISPRLAATYAASDAMTFHASYATYVAAIANSQGDAASSAGQPANFQWAYAGPGINNVAGAPLVTTEEALALLFAWFDANGGPETTTLPYLAASIPGLNLRIGDGLASPSVDEIALGGTFRIGSSGMVRADVVHREYGDMYSQRADRSTGQAINPRNGARIDVNFVENDDFFEREYDGVHTQFRFRPMDRLDLGGNYSWSEAKGNFEGENRGSGPIRATLFQYPEYRQASWNSPDGYLPQDQKHRASLYGIYTIIDSDRQSLKASLLGSYGSGLPYSALGQVRTGAYVDPALNAYYASEPLRVDYYFSRRGAFRTPDVYRADFSLNYDFRVGPVEIFVAPEVINITNEQNVDTTDVAFFGNSNTTIITADNTGPTSCNGAPCQAFNPFTTQPVHGVHWIEGSTWGEAINPNAFQQARTYRVSVGLRF